MCLVGTECDVESIDSRRFKQSGNHRERISSTKHDIGWIDTVGMSPYLPSRKIVRMFRKICPFYSSTGRKSDSWKSDTQLRLLRATAWVESEREKKNEKKREEWERDTKKSLPLSLSKEKKKEKKISWESPNEHLNKRATPKKGEKIRRCVRGMSSRDAI